MTKKIRSKIMKLSKTLALWCVLIVCCVTLFGCNTIHGAGEDIEQGGQAIQKAAER